MDHWGDPWSDNAHDASATKTEVTSPLPSAQSSAPVLLNGFLDDAGWGHEDASFGDWATAPEPSPPTAAIPHTPTGLTDYSRGHDISQDGAQWAGKDHGEPVLQTEDHDWHQNRQNTARIDSEPSEASDSATTVQQDESPDDATFGSSGQLQPDDTSSARPSTSLSERSHNEPSAESPRTSIEEERGAIKSLDTEVSVPGRPTVKAEQEGKDGACIGEGLHDPLSNSSSEERANVMAHEQDVADSVDEPRDTSRSISSGCQEDSSLDVHLSMEDSAPVDRRPDHNAFSFDTSLLDELFPPLQDLGMQDEAPDDPIYSTPGRKAWYRLTRRQTLREYNNGNADDNYIRVTWANSEIRKEVNKTVGRWAREDRLSGTGPGARASFYWDTAAPLEPKVPLGHSRTKTSVPTPRAVIPARQSLPPVATDAPAAFDWSSAAAADPWRPDGSALRSISSPLAAGLFISDELGKQASRDVSMELAPPDLGMRELDSKPSSETTGVASPIASPPTIPALSASPEKRNTFSSIDTDIANHENTVAPAVDDDDDDWGEMVGSPTLPEPENLETISQTTFSNDSIPTLPATPPPSRSFSAQKQPDTMHASHITRLKGTISPTSAIFGPRSFVPLGVEQGPIGPGILKPAKCPEPLPFDRNPKPLSAAPPKVIVVQKSHGEHVRPIDSPSSETAVDVPQLEPAFAPVEFDGFSPFVSSTAALPTAESGTLQASPLPQQPALDAWADADFSFFESTPPAPVVADTKQSRPDAFSILETPTRSARSSSAASSKSYARSPPRTSPPPIQPLTGATNAAQRRKDEEEKTIRDILGGLSDLGYMLR